MSARSLWWGGLVLVMMCSCLLMLLEYVKFVPQRCILLLRMLQLRPQKQIPIPHTMLALSTECLEGEGH
jgi:hypothetical protein